MIPLSLKSDVLKRETEGLCLCEKSSDYQTNLTVFVETEEKTDPVRDEKALFLDIRCLTAFFSKDYSPADTFCQSIPKTF